MSTTTIIILLSSAVVVLVLLVVWLIWRNQRQSDELQKKERGHRPRGATPLGFRGDT